MRIRRTRLLAVAASLLAASLLVACSSEGREVRAGGAPADSTEAPAAPAPEATELCAGAADDVDHAATCLGPSPEELRDLNLAYADRLPFAGDADEAALVVADVRAALEALVATTPDPTGDEVAAALRTAVPGEEPQVSTSAVRTAGVGFAVWAAGGCVFGSVHAGGVEVDISGPIADGGCLAVYGH